MDGKSDQINKYEKRRVAAGDNLQRRDGRWQHLEPSGVKWVRAIDRARHDPLTSDVALMKIEPDRAGSVRATPSTPPPVILTGPHATLCDLMAGRPRGTKPRSTRIVGEVAFEPEIIPDTDSGAD